MGFAGAIGLGSAYVSANAAAQAAYAKDKRDNSDVIDVEATDITDRRAINDSTGRVHEANGKAQALLAGPASE